VPSSVHDVHLKCSMVFRTTFELGGKQQCDHTIVESSTTVNNFFSTDDVIRSTNENELKSYGTVGSTGSCVLVDQTRGRKTCTGCLEGGWSYNHHVTLPLVMDYKHRCGRSDKCTSYRRFSSCNWKSCRGTCRSSGLVCVRCSQTCKHAARRPRRMFDMEKVSNSRRRTSH
jgi:hypothetical protein